MCLCHSLVGVGLYVHARENKLILCWCIQLICLLCSSLKTLHETDFFKHIIYKTNNEMEIDRGLVAASNSSFVCLFICFPFKLNYMCTPDIVEVSQCIIPRSK